MSNIHKKIAAARKLRGLSQVQLASHCNIALRTFQRLEAGFSPVSVDYLQRISKALRCNLEEIIDFDLENNQFSAKPGMLSVENQILKEENNNLRQFVKKLLERFHMEQMTRPKKGLQMNDRIAQCVLDQKFVCLDSLLCLAFASNTNL